MIKKLYIRYRDASPAVKASMALLFANLVLKGLSLISGPVFTRIMTTEQYGIVSTFLSWQSMLSVIITLNLSQGVFNNGMLDYKEDRDTFQFSLLFITSVMTIVFTGIFFCFKQYFLTMFELPEVLIFIMLAGFFTVPAYSFWSGRQRYEFKYKALTLITICNSVLALVIGIVAVVFVPSSQTAIARVCAMEGVNIAIGLFFYIYIGIKAKFKFKFSYCKYALKFNIPLLPHYLSMYVLASSDRIMITKMINASATAIYSVAYTVASVINIFWGSIEASLSPWIYEKLDQGDRNSVKNTSGKIMVFFAMMCISCTLFAPEIMKILAPSSYSGGIYAIPAVSAGVFFTAMYSLYMRVELFYKQTGFATIATTMAALANIGLNYVCISRFGYIAAGYTTMICYALLALFHYFNVQKKGFSDVFNNKLFMLVSMAVILLASIVSILYTYTIIRYCVIACVLVFGILKRKIIISIIFRK